MKSLGEQEQQPKPKIYRNCFIFISSKCMTYLSKSSTPNDSIYNFTHCKAVMKLTVSNGPQYRHLSVNKWSVIDCFKWGRRVICLWYLYVHWSLYILINWLFSNGGGGSSAFGIYICICLYILISWPFRIGVSLMTYISEEFTPSTGSFAWGGLAEHFIWKFEFTDI